MLYRLLILWVCIFLTYASNFSYGATQSIGVCPSTVNELSKPVVVDEERVIQDLIIFDTYIRGAVKAQNVILSSQVANRVLKLCETPEGLDLVRGSLDLYILNVWLAKNSMPHDRLEKEVVRKILGIKETHKTVSQIKEEIQELFKDLTYEDQKVLSRRVFFTLHGMRDLKDIENISRQIIGRYLINLLQSPKMELASHVKKLNDVNLRRFRAGRIRIFFNIANDGESIIIAGILQRSGLDYSTEALRNMESAARMQYPHLLH